jgi:valyl-tRNA synthetase
VSSFRFSDAYDTLYHFIWDDLADWYIEASKAEPNKPLLMHVLENVLIMGHPFAPFVTETIWQTLAWEGDSLLASKSYGKIADSDDKTAADFEEIKDIVSEVRFITKALQVVGATLYYTDVPFLAANARIIKRLARLHDVAEVRDGTGIYLTRTKHRAWLDIDPSTARQYLSELEGKASDQNAAIKRLEDRLANKSYVKNAPKEVVEQTKQQLKDAHNLLKTLEEEKSRFLS